MQQNLTIGTIEPWTWAILIWCSPLPYFILTKFNIEVVQDQKTIYEYPKKHMPS